jgi:hypothetical protein
VQNDTSNKPPPETDSTYRQNLTPKQLNNNLLTSKPKCTACGA